MRVILTRAGRDEKGNRDSRLAPVVPAPVQHQLLHKEEEFKMRKQLFALSLVGLLVIGLSLPLTTTATAHPSVVATINGGGVADMDDGEGPSLFGMGVKLLSDGSAQGFFDCVDQMGDSFPGNFYGQVTSWSLNEDGTISYSGIGKVVSFPPYFFVAHNLEFTVTIQAFGGPGVGHWTLDVPEFGGVICWETIRTGQVVIH